MGKSISVTENGTQIYQIALREDFGELTGQLRSLGYQKVQKICIVTDSNVEQRYCDAVQKLLCEYFDTVIRHVFPAGEESKNLDTVAGLYEALILHHFDRRDILVALGGGVVGDLTGFTAATYLRGIDFIQVPTTLLAQVDSSIGGKTGVDFLQYKNMVGAFYQPRLVYMNLATLNTLPKKQFISGMGEIIKHGLIKDASYYRWLSEHRDDILSLNPKIVAEMIYKSCNIKRKVVESDPTEKGERALLNFGHTVGHAVEKLCGFSLPHGECVGLGMRAALYLSAKLGQITQEELCDIGNCLDSFGFSSRVKGLDSKEILLATKSDKKMVGERIKFILLSAVGSACIYKDLTDAMILEGIHTICED